MGATEEGRVPDTDAEPSRISDEGETGQMGYDVIAVKYLARARSVLSLEGAESLPHVEHLLGVARVYALLELAEAVGQAEESGAGRGRPGSDPAPTNSERS